MSPTRIAESAKPPSVIDAGKIYTGISFVIPLSILMLGFIYAVSKTVETYNLDTVKRPGFDTTFYSSGFFAVASAISGGVIAGSCNFFASRPLYKFGSAVFPIFTPERGGVVRYQPPASNTQEHDDRPPGGPSDTTDDRPPGGPSDTTLSAPTEGPIDKTWTERIAEKLAREKDQETEVVI